MGHMENSVTKYVVEYRYYRMHKHGQIKVKLFYYKRKLHLQLVKQINIAYICNHKDKIQSLDILY